jgi:hypothetical protein
MVDSPLDSIIKQTFSRLDYLLRNGFPVPAFIRKRNDGISKLSDDYDVALSVIVDSYQDEIDYLERMENERA